MSQLFQCLVIRTNSDSLCEFPNTSAIFHGIFIVFILYFLFFCRNKKNALVNREKLLKPLMQLEMWAMRDDMTEYLRKPIITLFNTFSHHYVKVAQQLIE